MEMGDEGMWEGRDGEDYCWDCVDGIDFGG